MGTRHQSPQVYSCGPAAGERDKFYPILNFNKQIRGLRLFLTQTNVARFSPPVATKIESLKVKTQGTFLTACMQTEVNRDGV